MTDNGPAPLIVTATLPADLQSWANRLRQTHFPPERNFLEAHVTLFHALPFVVKEELAGLLADLAQEFAPPAATLESVMSLGGGTALKIASPAMLTIRDLIADRFHGMLSAQDRHRPRLHVTIQNKVSPQTARRLQAQLAENYSLQPFSFHGLALYLYRGGPWDHAGIWAFRG